MGRWASYLLSVSLDFSCSGAHDLVHPPRSIQALFSGTQFLIYEMKIISASEDLLKPVLLSYGEKKAPNVILEMTGGHCELP